MHCTHKCVGQTVPGGTPASVQKFPGEGRHSGRVSPGLKPGVKCSLADESRSDPWLCFRSANSWSSCHKSGVTGPSSVWRPALPLKAPDRNENLPDYTQYQLFYGKQNKRIAAENQPSLHKSKELHSKDHRCGSCPGTQPQERLDEQTTAARFKEI